MNEKYNELVKKFDLPKVEDFKKDFEYPDFENDNIVLSDIRKKMIVKVDYFISILSELIQPENNTNNIYELKFTTDKKREELFNLVKILMFYSRKSNALNSFYEENEELSFINDLFNEWQELKIKLKKELLFFSDIWKKDLRNEEIVEDYMG